MTEIWSQRIQNELIHLDRKANSNDDVTPLPKNTHVKKYTLQLELNSCFLWIHLNVQNVFFVVDAGGAKFANFPFEAPIIFLFFVEGDLPKNSSLVPIVQKKSEITDEAKLMHLFDNFHQIQKKVHNIIPLDIDWSPGLSLADVITHTSLKLRESMAQNEALHFDDELLDNSSIPLGVYGENNIVDNLNAGTQKLAEYFGKFSEKVEKIGQNKTTKIKADLSGLNLYECENLTVKKKSSNFFQQFLNKKHYLAVTKDTIWEVDHEGTVVVQKSLNALQKLKFRRGESITLLFSTSANTTQNLVYTCPKSEFLVKEIQSKMAEMGVQATHTNTLKNRAVTSAFNILELVNLKIQSENLKKIDEIDEIMDLYRQAAEKFAFAEDPRHHEVLKKMHNFLNQPWVQTILSMDDVIPAPTIIPPKKNEKNEPKPEILESPQFFLDEFYDENDEFLDEPPKIQKSEHKKNTASMDPVMDDVITNNDVISQELNEFLKSADRQLEDLMND